MKKQLSDEQLDQLLRRLMNDAAIDDIELDNIAESPSVWRNVQRNISQKTAPWPPPIKWLRAFMIGVPATAAIVLVVLFVFFGKTVDIGPRQTKASAEPEKSLFGAAMPTNVDPTISAIAKNTQKRATSKGSDAPSGLRPYDSSRTTVARSKPASVNTVPPGRVAASVKTDFIALSYADSPESGQIVRVKVPGSMMVTLGLVDSVAKPSELVDAEVLVGDDGLTHSIRFIRKGL